MHGLQLQKNINDTLFMRINSTDYNIKINAQNYNGDTFAIEIQTKINAILPNTFSAAFSPQQNNISIAVNNGTQFRAYTNKDLKTRFGTTQPMIYYRTTIAIHLFIIKIIHLFQAF